MEGPVLVTDTLPPTEPAPPLPPKLTDTSRPFDVGVMPPATLNPPSPPPPPTLWAKIPCEFVPTVEIRAELVTSTSPARLPSPPAPPRLKLTLFEPLMPPATLNPPSPPPPPMLCARIPDE